MNRREFLKSSALAAAAAGAASCTGAVRSVPGQESTLEMNGNVPVRGEDGIGLLGFGCMRLPMDGEEIDQEAVNEMVDRAMAHGVNYFDSSPVYLKGKSEEATAIALSRYPRDSYYIATKLSVWDADREKCMAMYRRSFEIYNTDHIDYYLLHSLDGADSFRRRFLNTGIMDFLLAERKAGRIRRLGFSFHGKESGFDSLMALHSEYHWDFVQIQMNYVDWKYASGRDAKAEYLYNALDRLEIPVVIMEPLLGGRLSEIPAPLAGKLKASEPSQSIASWAFRFCSSYPRVLTVLSGMSRMEHLEDNLRTFTNLKPLSTADYDLLDKIAASMVKYPLVRCTGCAYCMPCPYGIDIPGVFKFYNDRVNEASYVTGKEQKDYIRARRRYLLSYNRAVESARQADHCISCGKCVKLCPQHIRIPKEMDRINGYIEKLKTETL